MATIDVCFLILLYFVGRTTSFSCLSFFRSISTIHRPCNNGKDFSLAAKKQKIGKRLPTRISEIEELILEEDKRQNETGNLYKIGKSDDSGKVQFPPMDQASIDEQALRASPFGKVLFSVLDNLFPVFKEPNW